MNTIYLVDVAMPLVLITVSVAAGMLIGSFWRTRNGGEMSTPVCVRCVGTDPEREQVTVVFNGQSLCPRHALEVMQERGVTLNESFGCHHD